MYSGLLTTEFQMLATDPDHLPELPLIGSEGYLRGTGTLARVIRRNADRTCLVTLFDGDDAGPPVARPGSTGNSTVPEADLFPTRDAAVHCGRKARARTARRSER